MSDLSFAVESLTCMFTSHLNIKGGNVFGSPLHTGETLCFGGDLMKECH